MKKLITIFSMLPVFICLGEESDKTQGLNNNTKNKTTIIIKEPYPYIFKCTDYGFKDGSDACKTLKYYYDR